MEQRLKRLGKGFATGQHGILAPGGIGAVLFGEIRACHGQSRLGIARAKNLFNGWQHTRKRFAKARQFGPIQDHLPFDGGHRGVRIDKPGIP